MRSSGLDTSKYAEKGEVERGSAKTFKESESALKRIKSGKNLIKKNDQGDIVYPIVVNNSLVIENLGIIDWQRPQYHTEKNLFPIGFKSVREHQSVNIPGERCQYICEILDGGSKPLYKVTAMDD